MTSAEHLEIFIIGIRKITRRETKKYVIFYSGLFECHDTVFLGECAVCSVMQFLIAGDDDHNIWRDA